MKVSIVTVVYNGEDGILKTMESVRAQTHEDIEYLLIDGASKDGTLRKIEEYKDTLTGKGIQVRIVSEPDGGIYDAMNKGIRLATGDIIGILNCGDFYEPNAAAVAAQTFAEKECELMFANLRIHKEDGSNFVKKARLRKYQTSRDWNHPTTFVRSDLYKEYPFRKLGIHDDYGFYLQMCKQNRKIVVVDQVLANFVMGGVSNKKSLKAARKRIKDRYKYCYRINGYSRFYYFECLMMEAAKWILG